MNGPLKPPTLSARPPKPPPAGEVKATDIAERLRQAEASGFLETTDGSNAVSPGPGQLAGKAQQTRGRKGNPKNADRTQLIIRLPPDLHEQLKFVAKYTPHHTVQALIENLLLQGLPAELEKAKLYAEIMK